MKILYLLNQNISLKTSIFLKKRYLFFRSVLFRELLGTINFILEEVRIE